jgi:peroxiredoxin
MKAGLMSLLLLAPVMVQAELTDFRGEPVVIENEKIRHLVFTDIWAVYDGRGDEQLLQHLPASFRQQSQQIWIQPQLNVTTAQLEEFSGYYPQLQPLVLDKEFRLMRSEGVWESPYHVLYQGEQRVFSGSTDELRRYLGLTVNEEEKAKEEAVAVVSTAVTVGTQKKQQPVQQKKPQAGADMGDIMLLNAGGKEQSLKTLTAEKPLSLIFLDTLCPMPHFPGCEDKIAQLNQLVASTPERQWLGVVNSYYVNAEAVEPFRQRFKLTLPLMFDHEHKVFGAFDVHATPYQIDISIGGVLKSRGDQIQ